MKIRSVLLSSALAATPKQRKIAIRTQRFRIGFFTSVPLGMGGACLDSVACSIMAKPIVVVVIAYDYSRSATRRTHLTVRREPGHASKKFYLIASEIVRIRPGTDWLLRISPGFRSRAFARAAAAPDDDRNSPLDVVAYQTSDGFPSRSATRTTTPLTTNPPVSAGDSDEEARST